MSRFPNLEFGPMPVQWPIIGTDYDVELKGRLKVWWDGPYLGGHIIIPIRYIHNGPSTPKRLRGVIVRTNALIRPAIAHDFIYETKPVGWTREAADMLLLEGLKVEGVSWRKRNTMWMGVRAGGWVMWND